MNLTCIQCKGRITDEEVAMHRRVREKAMLVGAYKPSKLCASCLWGVLTKMTDPKADA